MIQFCLFISLIMFINLLFKDQTIQIVQWKIFLSRFIGCCNRYIQIYGYLELPKYPENVPKYPLIRWNTGYVTVKMIFLLKIPFKCYKFKYLTWYQANSWHWYLYTWYIYFINLFLILSCFLFVFIFRMISYDKNISCSFKSKLKSVIFLTYQ